MNLIEKLTSEELIAIKEYCMNYAGGPRHRQAEPEHILRFWAIEKENLFKIFGNKLILTKNISYQKEQSEMYAAFNRHLYTTKFDREFRRFYYQISNIDTYRCLYELIDKPTLYSNVYSGETFTLEFHGQSITIQKGCKAIKALGKIANAFHLDGFEEFRLAHSQCLNQKTVKGEICLSIHPLDYMTMSDNVCGWRSCMSWNSDGEYRQGTVEMMNSPVVVVAYLKSDSTTYPIGDLDWNSKKWRQLYIVSDEIITTVKQYPYDNKTLSTFCLKWLRDLAQESGVYGPYHPQMCRIESGRDNAISFLDTNVCVDIQPGGFMYDDYQFDPHDSFLSIDVESYISIDYSGVSQCMCCGDLLELDNEDEYASLLACESCNPIIHCCWCNDMIVDGDSFHWVDDNPICEYCYENNAVVCDKCNRTTFVEYRRVYLVYKDKILKSLGVIDLCDCCQEYVKYENYTDFISIESIEDEDERKEILSLFDVTSDDLEEIYNEN